MADDPYADRKSITFEQAEQAEGVEPLPSQLKLKELSPKLRALLWATIHADLVQSKLSSFPDDYINQAWQDILFDEHVERQFRMADDFVDLLDANIDRLRRVFEHGTYTDVFGFVQFVARHPSCPTKFDRKISSVLRQARAAYIIADKTIIPSATEHEGTAIVQAIADVSASELNGARQHLLNAASCLTTGDSAASIRESISAVESVAKILAPKGDFGDALNQIEKGGHIHGAMKDAFKKLYGYTSDEKGIRHSLLLEGQAQADEIDAQFMLGACASFVSYLVNKARAAGLLTNK